MKKILGKVTPTVAAVVTSTVLVGGGSAFAASQITSAQIKDHTITQADMTKRLVQVVQHQDLRDRQTQNRQSINALRNQVKGKASTGSVNDLQSQVSTLQAQVKDLQNGKSDNGFADWSQAAGTAVVKDAHTAVLTEEAGSTTGSSLENASIDLPIRAGQHIKFTYTLSDGAKAANGAPRVFIVVGGKYYSTIDNNGSLGYGTENADGSWTVDVAPVQMNDPNSAPMPSGRVSYAGIVYDNTADPGTVTVTDLSIAGHAISFE